MTGSPMRSMNGFTLVEMLVVVVVVGVLAGMLVPKLMNRAVDARIQAATEDLRTIEMALQIYKLDNYSHPPPELGLLALVERPPGSVVPNWPEGGYLDKLPTDPWERLYLFDRPGPSGAEFALYSLGSDGQPGGHGDRADIALADL